jgi:hypothetical protein
MDAVRKMDSRVSTFEEQARQAQVEKESAKLDSLFKGLHSKYDLGDKKLNAKIEELVLARAQMLGRDPAYSDFEKFFKEEYDSFIGFAKTAGEKQFRSQKDANLQAKDIGPGGGVATTAPVTPKTFKEAREAMESHLAKQKWK